MICNNSLLKEPKISIIITYYNLENYVVDCVRSILNQSYKNFEIIIVNDGSDKKNSEILNNSVFKDEKIEIINLEKNSGQLLAFLKGLEIATGEFICMIDADDILLEHHLKTLLYVHLNHKTALVSSNFGEIDSNNQIVLFEKNEKKTVKFNELESFFTQEKEFKINYNKLPFGLWGWRPATSGMFRKSSLEILKYFPEKKYWKTGADKVVFSLLHLVGGSINISAITYLYRHHDKNNSATTLTSGNKKYLSENYVKMLINWNIKLRVDTLKMFFKNKKEFIEKFNKLNYYKMLFRVIFCVNIKVCAKILKTLAHKIV